MSQRGRWIVWVLIGDTACALAISIIGFLTHYGQLEGWRWLSTFIPVLVGWLIIAPWLGNYQPPTITNPFQSWRAALAAFLVAPLAAWLRGTWLNSPILPLFVLVLGLTNALGFLIWRVILSLILRRMKRNG
jgi:hypothetical protein